MKLRNKLVAVMAASMVVTSVPVVTMADSSNTLSIYNYNIKDTTVGFESADLAYGTTNVAIDQLYTGTKVVDDEKVYVFNANSVPHLQIEPDSTETVDQQSAFISLTKDSSFQEDAYMYYMDAIYEGKGFTPLYFNKDGKVEKANNPDWIGKTKAQIKEDETKIARAMGFENATFVYTIGEGEDRVKIGLSVSELSESTIASEGSDRKYKSTLRIDFQGKFKKGYEYAVPFLAKVGGDDEVLAYLDGKDSFVSSKLFTITGKLSDKTLVATSDSNTITIDNIEEIGEIRLDENQVGALADAENKWIKLKLDSSADLEFNLDKTEDKIKAVGRRGFAGEETAEGGVEVKYGKTSRSSRDDDKDDDNQVLLVKLPDWSDSAKGQVVLKGIYVEPQEKTAATGDVYVTVSEDTTRGREDEDKDSFKSTKLVDSTKLKVATVADYGVTIESTPVDVKAGRSGILSETKATFMLKEAVKDSLVDSRKIEFSLENGYIFGPADVDYDADSKYNSDSYVKAAKDKFLKLIEDETIKFEEKAGADGEDEGFVKSSLSLDIDANGYVVGFTGRYDRLSDEKDDKIKVTLPVAAPVMAKGEIKVKAGNLFTRAHEKDAEAVIAKIVEPISVEVENAAIKVGLQEQVAGKVTIKETNKGMIERGWLFLAAEDLQEGITFEQVPDVKVASGNMTIDNVQISRDKKVVALEVTKTSTEASSIEVSNIKFTADRTVPEANYDLQIWGDALTDENVLDVISNTSLNVLNQNTYRSQYTDMYVVPEFITMTTKNTQDIDASGLKAATASFVIGQNSFVVNGETVAMDSAAYIKDNYTMVPVKYVAKAFGIEGNAIQYDQATSTATIVAGNKVISITAGKAYIVVNGTNVPMATKAEVVDGRMCVPMAYIASALDVQKSWDAATKTATFTNQAENK